MSLFMRIVLKQVAVIRDAYHFSATKKILSDTLLSRITPYLEEIIGHHQCGFRCNRSTTDHIFCIRQILEKKWEYTKAVHQLFIDLKKAYDSIRMVLHNILVETGIPMKMVRLIKRCLNESYSRIRVRSLCPTYFQLRMV